MQIKSLTGFLLALLTLPLAHAEEGMWQPHQLPALSAELKSLGLQVAPDKLNDLLGHPMNAIVSLGNCSASFVSPEGLAVTNHHCVQRILQHNSTPESNLIESGYLAEDLAHELPGNPGSRIYVTVEVSDVTRPMLAGLSDEMDPLARHQALEQHEKALVAECERGEGFRCGVHSFFEGLQFFLIKQLEIRDVRLVHSPPRSIGEFGGDIDNWMWPRHTGDYSFLRGYVAPDGTPADYDVDNVPYRPEHYLRVSTAGLAEGDFVMAIGYPGRTYRHRLASEAGEIGSWYYPTRKKLYEDMLTVIERETSGREAAAIRYSSLVQGLNNVIKNYGGMIDGFARSGLVARKQATEDELRTWLDDNGEPGATGSLDELNGLIVEYRAGREQRMVYRDFLRRRAALLSAASQLYRLSREKEKTDAEREPGYQKRDWRNIRETMARLENSFDKQVDRALFQHHLALYAGLPEDQRIAALDEWFGIGEDGYDEAGTDARIDELYEKTTLDRTDNRMTWLDASRADFESSDDPFIRLAVALYDSDIERETSAKRYLGRFQLARSRYMAALSKWLEQQNKALYADANGTLRVTFGQIAGYRPRDAVEYDPFTTVQGIVEKTTGEKPFKTPAPLLVAIDQKLFGTFADSALGSVPVNFLATLDSTGGNSGSAVLDGHGELVGLLFDGNYEAINADWYLDAAISRSICVDIRYVLWIMETVEGAQRLMREMGIGPMALHARRQPAGVD